MTDIRTILSQVERRLRDTHPEIACIGRNRGQLAGDPLAVTWPCILLDIATVDYSCSGSGTQMADARITVTVADATAGDDTIMQLLESVHAALHLFTTGDCAPLHRTALRRGSVDAAKESYEMTYATTYGVAGDADGTTVAVRDIDLQLR